MMRLGGGGGGEERPKERDPAREGGEEAGQELISDRGFLLLHFKSTLTSTKLIYFYVNRRSYAIADLVNLKIIRALRWPVLYSAQLTITETIKWLNLVNSKLVISNGSLKFMQLITK